MEFIPFTDDAPNPTESRRFGIFLFEEIKVLDILSRS